MILNATSIRDARIITPHREAYTHANGMSGGQSIASYDVHAAEDVTVWPVHMSQWAGPSGCLYPDRKRPHFIIAATEEYLRMPTNVGGIFALKSTHARMGINQPVTWIDPGFGLQASDPRGCQLVVELSNFGPRPVEIPAGSPIGQIVFYRTEPTDGYAGRYVDQVGAQGPMGVSA